MRTQRAIVSTAPREASLVTDRALPKLRDDYILVKTEAVAINPTDWKHIDFLNTPGTLVGCDYAGVVVEVGSRVTKKFAKGDRITGMVHGSNSVHHEDGTFAEYIVVKGDIQIHIPDHMSFEEAATLGVGVTTVGQGLYQTLKLPLPTAPATSPTPILIYGGSTATGALAIQYAKLSGYAPIATCGRHNFEMVKKLGAVAVFDYSDVHAAQKIREYTEDNLMLAWDTLSLEASAQFCADALSTKGGKYAALLPVQCPRDDVESSTTMAYTVTGEPLKMGRQRMPVTPQDYEFGKMWWSLSEDLFREGKIHTHKLRIGKDGLMGVLDGLQLMRDDKISGEKLVYRVDETPCF